jgi:hypothetical protein
MIEQPDPTYYATVTFAGKSFELWRSKWTVKRTAYQRWYARYEGQSETAFNDTRSDGPAAALGTAILLMAENDAVCNRIWGN